MEHLKPQHEYPLIEVAGKKEPTNQEKLLALDQWMEILFPQMEADYQTMHRLPKKLERGTSQ